MNDCLLLLHQDLRVSGDLRHDVEEMLLNR
jgi:hypothetical protein